MIAPMAPAMMLPKLLPRCTPWAVQRGLNEDRLASREKHKIGSPATIIDLSIKPR
jgi:hypothetical protein